MRFRNNLPAWIFFTLRKKKRNSIMNFLDCFENKQLRQSIRSYSRAHVKSKKTSYCQRVDKKNSFFLAAKVCPDLRRCNKSYVSSGWHAPTSLISILNILTFSVQYLLLCTYSWFIYSIFANKKINKASWT